MFEGVGGCEYVIFGRRSRWGGARGRRVERRDVVECGWRLGLGELLKVELY